MASTETAGGVTDNRPKNADPRLWNPDLGIVPDDERTWNWVSIASLWVGMVVCVPTYFLAAGLVAEGMAWWQAVLTVFLGNLIVLVPMALLGHAGTKHGIAFPVLLRSSFGPIGARVPALARGLVACGWFGIQTWVGGSAIYVILNTLTGNAFQGEAMGFLGIDIAQFISFLAFWAMHLYFIKNGTESIRWLETYAAPFLLAMGLALLLWAYVQAGGFGVMLSTPSAFVPGGAKEGQFWAVFIPGLTAMVGFWATLALNIPDFTRHAKSQKDQILGQLIGLPIPMALFAFISIAVTSATVVIYGEAIWDPIALVSRMGGFGVIIALFALIVATLTTNMAANVVAPSYSFTNLSPSKISLVRGGYITAGIGIAIMPWKLLESAGGFLFVWLVGYSALLGPIAGVMLADYYLLRKTELDHDDLFRVGGKYGNANGWNHAGIIAMISGALPSMPGFFSAAGFIESVPSFFDTIYSFAWFVGLFLGGAIYMLLTRNVEK